MDSVEAELICGVCLEIFKNPVVLPCSHNFCSGCIRDVAYHGRHGNFRAPPLTVICPTCRKSVDIAKGLHTLTSNRALERIAEVVQGSLDSRQSAQYTCFKHADFKTILFCKTCHKNVCSECAKESHQGFGHIVKYTNELVIEQQDIVAENIEEVKRLQSSLKRKEKSYRDRETDIRTKLNDDITAIVKPLRGGATKCVELHLYANCLIDSFNHIKKEKRSPLDHKLKKLEKLNIKMNQFLAFEGKKQNESTVPSIGELKIKFAESLLFQERDKVDRNDECSPKNVKVTPGKTNSTLLQPATPDMSKTLWPAKERAVSVEKSPTSKLEDKEDKKVKNTSRTKNLDSDDSFSFEGPSFSIGRY